MHHTPPGGTRLDPLFPVGGRQHPMLACSTKKKLNRRKTKKISSTREKKTKKMLNKRKTKKITQQKTNLKNAKQKIAQQKMN